MENVSNIYDSQNEFAGDLAAKLIAGAADYADRNQDAYKIVLKELVKSYNEAFSYFRKIQWVDDVDKWRKRHLMPPTAIQSSDMQKCLRLLDIDPTGATFSTWLESSKFENQVFERNEIVRWLEEIGLSSAYRFDSVEVHEAPRAAIAGPTWGLRKPSRFQGYRKPLFDYMKAAHTAGEPCPNARDVLDAWKLEQPHEIVRVENEDFVYLDGNGDSKLANLDALRQTIARMKE